MTQRAFFWRLNTFCSSFWVAKLPAAPAAPRAADLANFLPAPLARDRPSTPLSPPASFHSGHVCWPLLVPGFFILSSQGIQRLGHGAQEFEEKIASHLVSSQGWGSKWSTAFAAFRSTRSFDFWHDVTGTRVSSPFILGLRGGLVGWVRHQSRVHFLLDAGTCWASTWT